MEVMLKQYDSTPVLSIADNKISEILRSDYRTADVFKKYNINFCCSGEVSLEFACASKNLDLTTVINELEEATRNIHLPNNLRFNEWKVEFLVDYIINIHHAYLQQAIPSLELRLVNFIEGHKKKFPELVNILDAFIELSKVLLPHIRHEEEIIFPYIKQIDNAWRKKEPYGNLFVRTLRKPLTNIEKDHTLISIYLKNLRKYSNNFQFPANACTNHQVLYHKLREFHDDMIQHKHLENNILFPRAVEIECELLRL